MTEISKNIMKLHENMYCAACGCGNKDHQQTLVLEGDKELKHVSLSIYSEINTSYIYHDSRWKSIFRDYKFRIKSAIKLLFTGYIQAENEFIFNDRESIEGYIKALTNSLKTFE